MACTAGSSLLIVGGGSVRLRAMVATKIQGCAAIIVIEPHAARRDLSVKFGATHVPDPADHPDLTAKRAAHFAACQLRGCDSSASVRPNARSSRRLRELRHADWSEVDLEGSLWTNPPEKMKMRIGLYVPLSRQAVTLFGEVRSVTSFHAGLIKLVISAPGSMPGLSRNG